MKSEFGVWTALLSQVAQVIDAHQSLRTSELENKISSKAKYTPLTVFVNNILWEQGHSHHFCTVCGCFPNTMTELSSCDINHMAQTLKVFTICPFTEEANS